MTDELPPRILEKMRHYCAYQERCEADVRGRMDKLPLTGTQKDEIVRQLADGKFIDEDRYTALYIQSKMRNGQWGRLKIRQGLLQKKIRAEVIERHLRSVDDDEYAETMRTALAKWRKTHPEDKDNRQKIFAFLLSKGYAADEIHQISGQL